MYAERAYFTSDACQHCATRDEYLRIKRIEARNRSALRGLDRCRRVR